MTVQAIGRQDVQSRLAEALMARGKLDAAGLRRAERLCEGRVERLSAMLPKLGLVSDRDLAQTMAEVMGLKFLEPRELPRESVAIDGLSVTFLRESRILPIGRIDGAPVLAMADPTDTFARDAFRMVAGEPARVVVAEASAIEAAITNLYGSDVQAHDPAGPFDASPEVLDTEVERLRDQASGAPVIRLVNAIITEAVESRASDIHLEPFERELRLRYRVDGLLIEREAPPLDLAPALVSRIKIMARLDIAERRRPQDGRIRIAVRGKPIDLRVSILPVMQGESVVLRVLDRDSVSLDLAGLGIPADARTALAGVLARPEGILLVTGPTGSGKTTTLYAALSSINRTERKIITVEDPIEYQLHGVSQIQVNPAIGLDFAEMLRSMLRHNPEVMMVGEIRDGETAQVATQAALTGHLVISTLHTNDAASAVTRLTEMGIEPFLIASTLSAVAAQRLVRRLCPACRRPERMPVGLAERYGLDTGATLWRAAGCESCSAKGYRGRTVIFELLEVGPEIRDLVLARAPAAAILDAAVARGMRTMFHDGIEKALAGVTTLEEVLRTTRGP